GARFDVIQISRNEGPAGGRNARVPVREHRRPSFPGRSPSGTRQRVDRRRRIWPRLQAWTDDGRVRRRQDHGPAHRCRDGPVFQTAGIRSHSPWRDTGSASQRPSTTDRRAPWTRLVQPVAIPAPSLFPSLADRGAGPMTIIDSQVHAYEANTPKRPWHTVPNWPAHVTGDEMVTAMDAVGVDGAIFISSFSMYRYDASYAVEVQRAHPGRMAIVKPVDPDDPA